MRSLIAAACFIAASPAGASGCLLPSAAVNSFTALPSSFEHGTATTLTLNVGLSGPVQNCSFTDSSGTYFTDAVRIDDFSVTFASGDGRTSTTAQSGLNLAGFNPNVTSSAVFIYDETGTFTATASGFLGIALHTSGTRYSFQNGTAIALPVDLGWNPSPVQLAFQSATTVVSHAPEPSTYGMLLAGLGVLAFRVRRKKCLQT